MKKTLLSAVAFLVGTSAFACPDFSGTYKFDGQGQDVGVQTMTIVQKGCESLTSTTQAGGLSSTSPAQTLDGIFRQNAQAMTMARFDGDSLSSVSITPVDPKANPVVYASAVTTLSKDPGGNLTLALKVYDNSGSLLTEGKFSLLRQ